MNQIFLSVKRQKNTPLYLFTFASTMSQSVHAWNHFLLKFVALTPSLTYMLQTVTGIHGIFSPELKSRSLLQSQPDIPPNP